MRSSSGEKKSSVRRFVWLSVAIVTVIIAYVIGWHLLANRALTEVTSAIAAANRDDRTVECASPAMRGFPFRMGLFCDRVSIADAGLSLHAGAFRSVAQVYDPLRLVGELDGPAELDLGEIGTFTLSWENLRASTRLSCPLPSRASVESRAVTVRQAGNSIASFDGGLAHMRVRGADLDVAGTVENLRLDTSVTGGPVVPAFGADIDIALTDGVALALGGSRSLRGVSGTMNHVRLRTKDGGSLALSGPFTVGANGLLDARLTISVVEAKAFAGFLGDLLPGYRDRLDQAFAGLAMLGDRASLPLSVKRGKAVIGFIPLGDIPPL